MSGREICRMLHVVWQVASSHCAVNSGVRSCGQGKVSESRSELESPNLQGAKRKSCHSTESSQVLATAREPDILPRNCGILSMRWLSKRGNGRVLFSRLWWWKETGSSGAFSPRSRASRNGRLGVCVKSSRALSFYVAHHFLKAGIQTALPRPCDWASIRTRCTDSVHN